jgi:hypothetical protein
MLAARTARDGGTVAGTGTAAILDLRAGGILAPGDNGVGTLTAGDLNLNAGTFNAQILALNQFDKVAVTGNVNIFGNVALSLSLGGYNPSDLGTDRFTLVDNRGVNPLNATGVFTVGGTRLGENAMFVAAGQEWLISYQGGDGNDIVLTAIPEPGSVASLLGGLASLMGMQRFRRRKA